MWEMLVSRPPLRFCSRQQRAAECAPHLPPRCAGSRGRSWSSNHGSSSQQGTEGLSPPAGFFFSPQEANSGVYFRLQEQFIPIHFQQSLRAIQLAFVSLNACDDFASGELQENPQVGSETSVPLFPFLLVRRMDFSGCALCSLLLPWIHQRLIFLLHVAPSHSK